MQQRYGLILAFLIGSTALLLGQPLPYTAQQLAKIERSGQVLQQFRDENYQRAVTKAIQLGRPITQIQPNGKIIQLHSITDTGELLYLTTYNNSSAAATTRTNTLYEGGSLGLSLSGGSTSVKDRLGIWDGGRVRSTHVELKGRVTQMDNPAKLDSTSESQEHATHVSGTLIGAGVNPLARGMAYRANLKAWDFSSDVAEATPASTSLLVSNHSYGFLAGWNYNASRATTIKWEWLGDTSISQTDDYKYGFYDTDAQNWDRIVVNAPYYLPVRSAGNDHLQDRPAAGESYYLGSNGSKLSTLPRNNQTGYDQVVLSANAKNVLSIGAIAATPDGYAQPADVRLAYFSAWGPTDDGRIKPDLLGVGLNVLSSDNKTDSSYISLQGTSMSSPNVAGSLLLLQEYFAQLNAGRVMRASTLKGLVLHTADEAGTAPGPDYQNGWGLLNMERAARVIGNTDKSNVLDERTINQGETYTLPVVASGKGPLVVSIAWTDPEGTVVTASKSTINSRTPKLVNDLDIRVADGTQTRLPWTLNPDQPAVAATPGDNIRDNIEQVLIANPVPGKSYTITIGHKGTLKNSKQDYVLLVSGVGGVAYCASGAGTSADSRIDRVQFGSINQSGSTGCTTATDNTTLTAADVQVNQTLPLSVTVGTCGTARNTIVKAFIDWNLDGVFDAATETVATSGVLASGSNFSANVQIPATLRDGQFTRLRIVQVATEDPAAVMPCGTYPVGETQDYTLRFVRPASDAGVLALVAPNNGFCSQAGGGSVTVQIRNFGTASQTTIPVAVKILDPSNTVVGTLTGTSVLVAAFTDVNVSLPFPASLVLQPGQTYTFVASTTLPGDLNAGNDQLTQTRVTAPTPTAGTLTAQACGTDGAVTLASIGGTATAYWYDAPVGGNLLAVGNQTTTPVRPANNVYYVGLNDFSGRLGPAAKSDFGGGSYSGNFGPYPLITTKVPVVLKSARLYTGGAGRLTFTVRKLTDGTPVSTVSLDVAVTRTLPLSATIANGQLADDPNDAGAEYPLNLTIPQPGDYAITIEYAGGVSIFRSNTAVTGFPYSLSGIISTKGSLFNNAATSTVDTLTSAWYYFYNLQVGALGCSGTQRTAVNAVTTTAPTATVTANGSTSICQGSAVTLSAGTNAAGVTYQWLLNGQPVSGATAATYRVTTGGNYAVRILGGCTTTSATVAVVVGAPVLPVVTQNGLVLTSNAVTGNQWLLNGVVIQGATSATYVVSQTGRYSVRASVNGCGEAVSDDAYVAILATEPVVADNLFRIYPNPASKLITVEAAAGDGPAPTLQLIDARGALLHTTAMQVSGKLVTATVDVSALPGGTFFVRLSGDPAQGVRVKRFSKP